MTEAQTEPVTAEAATEPATTEAATTQAATTEAATTQMATTETATTEEETTEEETTEEETTEEETEEDAGLSTTSYTVTFTYNDRTFATQTVTSGGTASEPKLRPAPNGSWYIDKGGSDSADESTAPSGAVEYSPYTFGTPVTGDITLIWMGF